MPSRDPRHLAATSASSRHDLPVISPSPPPALRMACARQVKQISGRARQTLGEVMVALAERRSDDDPQEMQTISRLALER